MDIRKDILWRVYLCFLCIIVFGLFVLGKTIYIQRVEGKFWKGMGDSMQLRYVPVLAERGSIYSEDGNLLSTSVPVYDVYVDFGAEGLREKGGYRFKDTVQILSDSLSWLFGDRTPESYKHDMEQAYQQNVRYYLLKRKVSFDLYKRLRNFPLVRINKNKSGFIFVTRDKRINPYVLLANRTIGLSRKDSSKNVGLERSYDSLLRGINGQKLMRYSAGTFLPVPGAEVDPINGKDIITTLDTYIQDVAETELMNKLVDNNSLHGTVIVMEVATGKIKAIANLGMDEKTGTFTENLNYGFGKATEPGSVFKLVTLLSLLDDKYVTTDTKVDCEGGSKYFHGLRIKDSHLGAGLITVKNAFYTSSNVAFAKLAYQYYQEQPNKWYQHLEKFRLTQLTGIDIVASSGMPIVKSPKNPAWGKTTIPYMAHGYEELVTPLHMLTLYNAVANNGKLMRPYLVSGVREYGKQIRSIEPEVLVEKIVHDSAILQAKACLRAVVDSAHGTGHAYLFDSAYSISGKTGTAVSAENNKGYRNGKKTYQSSFIGYFPSDKPVYSMAVVIQNKPESKQYYGAVVAGTVFKKISDKIYNRFIHQPISGEKIKKDTTSSDYVGWKQDFKSIFQTISVAHNDKEQSNAYWGAAHVKQKEANLTSVNHLNVSQAAVVPELKGLGLKDALYLLEEKGLVAMVNGKGKVVTQSIPAGSNYTKGQKIILMLN
jgi:cell division protein FtsI (penicillin-binding protein 3)